MPSLNRNNQPSITSRLLKASNILLKALQEENDALEKGGMSKSQAVVAKKVEAINAYGESQEKFLEFSRNSKVDKNDSQVQKITEMMHQIKKENEKNEYLLRINIEISEKIIATYKEAEIKNAVNKRGYNSQGKVNSSKENKGIMPAVSLNDKI